MESEKKFSRREKFKEITENEKGTTPFSVKEVFDKKETDFIIYDSEKKNEKDIYEEIRKSLERKYWWINEKWREKGLPREQIEMRIGDHKITVYNFNKEIEFSDKHIKETADVLQKYGNYDPEIIKKIGFLLIDDKQNPSLLEDEKNFPINGRRFGEWGVIGIDPRGMRLDIGHRIPGILNFKGTLGHGRYP